AFSECSLVMVGPCYNILELPQRKNIYWLGHKPYTQLAAYLTHFDVGIIPFRNSSMTQAVNPIKMWEYLAAGIPVVSTELPETKGYGQLVLTADNRSKFVSHIELALSENNPTKKAHRRLLAKQNSWEIRAQLILDIIEQHLQNSGIERGPEPILPKLLFKNAPTMCLHPPVRIEQKRGTPC
ncbi:MAG: glycosyltransferase, partial [Methylocystaceae bacterium]